MPKSVLIIGLMTKNYRFSNKNGRTSQKWLNFDLKPLFVLNNFNFTKQKKNLQIIIWLRWNFLNYGNLIIHYGGWLEQRWLW